jgi:hypothetical protein
VRRKFHPCELVIESDALNDGKSLRITGFGIKRGEREILAVMKFRSGFMRREVRMISGLDKNKLDHGTLPQNCRAILIAPIDFKTIDSDQN